MKCLLHVVSVRVVRYVLHVVHVMRMMQLLIARGTWHEAPRACVLHVLSVVGEVALALAKHMVWEHVSNMPLAVCHVV